MKKNHNRGNISDRIRFNRYKKILTNAQNQEGFQNIINESLDINDKHANRNKKDAAMGFESIAASFLL
jgi:hypothetical protein